MRLKYGSNAWRVQLKVTLERLRGLLKENKRDDNSRYYADHAIKLMAEAIGGIQDFDLKYSLVRKEEPRIEYINEVRRPCGFYVKDDQPVHLFLRADEYWEAAAAILAWFNDTGRRYLRRDTATTEEGGDK